MIVSNDLFLIHRFARNLGQDLKRAEGKQRSGSWRFHQPFFFLQSLALGITSSGSECNLVLRTAFRSSCHMSPQFYPFFLSRPDSKPSIGKCKAFPHIRSIMCSLQKNTWIALDHFNVLGMQERWVYQTMSFWSTDLLGILVRTWSLLRESSVVAADAFQVQHEYDQQMALL